jgi:hypothetical protein
LLAPKGVYILKLFIDRRKKMMKRQQFVSLMAGISLAFVIAFTGCDDVLAEIQKGLGAATADTAGPESFADVVTQMATDAAEGIQSATYTLPGDGKEEPYTDDLKLTPGVTCPAVVTIDGGGDGGWTVKGGTNGITVGTGVSLTLKNIKFTNLPLTAAAGGTLTLDNGAVVSDVAWPSHLANDIEGVATAVDISGTLVMKAGALVTNNDVAGVVLEDNAVFTMDGGEVSHNGNSEDNWGNVVLYGTGSSFTMSGGLLSNSVDAWWGGGAFLYGENSVFTMTGGEISGNETIAGGGVMLWQYANTTFNMEGGVIKNNSATDSGGGVNVLITGTFNMTGGEIKDNTAADNGGGVSFFQYTTFTGNPSIGTYDPTKGSIYDNEPDDVHQD